MKVKAKGKKSNNVNNSRNNLGKTISLGARDGLIQPIFTEGLTTSACKSDKMH